MPMQPTTRAEKDEIEEPPTSEPASVWLVPLDNLEEDEDELPLSATESIPEQPSAEHEAEPSVVWLAPSSDPAELAPISKDDSSSVSSWSQAGEETGPWLAPI